MNDIDALIESAQSWNGYERERAVRQLGTLHNPDRRAIATLLKRTNDWVLQVRAAAVQSILRLLVSKNTVVFIEALPEVYHLRNCYRDTHGSLIAKIELFLLRDENRDDVFEGIKSTIKGVGRWCLQLSIEHQLFAPDKIFLQSQYSHDVIVRATAVQLLDQLTTIDFEQVIEYAVSDSFMPVRREGLLIALNRFPERSLSIIQKMLSDRSISIRERGIAYAVEQGFDSENFYVQTLSNPREHPKALKIALLGLSEIQSLLVLDIAVDFLESRLPSLRKASLLCLVRTDTDNAPYYLDLGLHDSASSVRKEAIRLMQKHRIMLSEAELIELYSEKPGGEGLQCVIRLNKYRPRWGRLLFLMWLLNQEMAEVSLETIDLEYRNWIAGANYCFAPPRETEKRRIRDRLSILSKSKYHDPMMQYLRTYLPDM